MHFKTMPNKKSLVILRSQGKFTNIFPRAVIFGTYDLSANGGGSVKAPVYYKFFIALQISLNSGG